MHKLIAATAEDAQHLADHLSAVEAQVASLEDAQHKTRYAAAEANLRLYHVIVAQMQAIMEQAVSTDFDALQANFW